jgi:glutamate synthase domain-containing protein 2
MDREELPFNRADRSWVCRAAKKIDTTIAFGSTRPPNIQGEPIFINCPFSTLDKDVMRSRDITIGDDFVEKPYTTNSIINISGMSFGAISKPAVQALSKGAKTAGIWMNTGEGGISLYHLEGSCNFVY